MPNDYPRAQILAALDRAARYRRSLARDANPRAHPVMLANEITGTPGRPVIHLDRDGWAEIGSVSDGIVGGLPLAVFWHPVTDRVRVERPPDRTPSLGPSHALYASSRPMGGSNSPTPPPFIALPGFIFTFEGRDYTREETERLTAERGSLEGWTWRRKPGRS